MGNILALAPRDDRLAGSRSEVNAIAEMFGDRATVLTGTEASEERFAQLASEYDVLHLATYGVLNKHNPLFSYIDLNGTEARDGRLEVHEVFSLQLKATLVVLSACEQYRGEKKL